MTANWKLGDALGIQLDQISDEETRDAETLDRMLEEINQVAAGYGFKIRRWGPWPDFRRMADMSKQEMSDLVRKQDLSDLANVLISQVYPVSSDEVRIFYADRPEPGETTIGVMLNIPANYWRVDDKYYFDDSYFGDVVAIDDLGYSEELGLHVRRGE